MRIHLRRSGEFWQRLLCNSSTISCPCNGPRTFLWSQFCVEPISALLKTKANIWQAQVLSIHCPSFGNNLSLPESNLSRNSFGHITKSLKHLTIRYSLSRLSSVIFSSINLNKTSVAFSISNKGRNDSKQYNKLLLSNWFCFFCKRFNIWWGNVFGSFGLSHGNSIIGWHSNDHLSEVNLWRTKSPKTASARLRASSYKIIISLERAIRIENQR